MRHDQDGFSLEILGSSVNVPLSSLKIQRSILPYNFVHSLFSALDRIATSGEGAIKIMKKGVSYKRKCKIGRRTKYEIFFFNRSDRGIKFLAEPPWRLEYDTRLISRYFRESLVVSYSKSK